MAEKEISRATLKRLPTYLSYLKSISGDEHVNISATALAGALHIPHTQQRVLFQRHEVGEVGDVRQAQNGRIQWFDGPPCLQPGGKGALSLLQGEFPVSFLASTGDTALSLHWTSGPPSSRSGCRGRCVPDKS